jgi:hypothetical protein
LAKLGLFLALVSPLRDDGEAGAADFALADGETGFDPPQLKLGFQVFDGPVANLECFIHRGGNQHLRRQRAALLPHRPLFREDFQFRPFAAPRRFFLDFRSLCDCEPVLNLKLLRRKLDLYAVAGAVPER